LTAVAQPTGARQRRTLQKIFSRPAPNDIPWADIESLLRHLGCTIEYRGGSKILILMGKEGHFEHRPHPSKQTPSRTTERIRDFLTRIGVTP